MGSEGSARTPLGTMLVERGVITAEQRDQALEAQGRTLLPIGSTIVALGLADEHAVCRVLAEQRGVPAVVLGDTQLDTSVLDVLPEQVAQSHGVLPLEFQGQNLHLAMANPDDRTLLDEVAFASGRRTLPFIALTGRLGPAVEEAYTARRSEVAEWKGSSEASGGVSVVRPEAEAPADEALAAELHPEGLESFPKRVSQAVEVRDDSGKPRVLAVDDEPEILDLLTHALTARGMEVHRATRGREALEMLQSVSPDVVLLDAMLPEIHGFEICSKIKASKQFAEVPVMMISAIYTGWNFIQDVKRIYGADEYLSKPFRVVEVVRRVEELLQKSKKGHRAPDVEAAVEAAKHALEEATAHCQNGELGDWLSAAKRAVQADPFDPRTHFMLGTALHRSGHLYEAISEYERVVELAPGQFSALKNLAVLYERQGFKAKAVEMWMRALNQSPSDPVRKTIKAHLIGLL